MQESEDPEDAGQLDYWRAGPAPDSLRRAADLINAHVNRLAGPRKRHLEELDRCAAQTCHLSAQQPTGTPTSSS